MKMLLAIALATGVAVTAVSPAEARQGCGAGFHRGPRGGCRPNAGRAPVLVVGNYYHGQGYWDGRRYWRHRERHRGGWRYR